MTKRMLIDATHAEETRVVVLDGNKLEDYDVETSSKKQLKGNIYLAKVVRVEPSLQAAFVDYGGNRHGFLAFSEIHPDYYQIPVADREKLLALQEEEARLEEAHRHQEDDLNFSEDIESTEADDPEQPADFMSQPLEAADEGYTQPDTVDIDVFEPEEALVPPPPSAETEREESVRGKIARFLRNYKIQEVIRRRQIILVQVIKEERGNKGAALTTYISLAGRYSVLMPNTPRGGGISRKIISHSDRRRLKDIINSLGIPRGMAMIIRTAGAQRPSQEITRDCEYLLRLWDDIREQTLQSVAPKLVYEEATLIKRVIRDVFTNDIEEILVDGETGWKAVRDFTRVIMPHNAHKVQLWRANAQPLFSHYQVEKHLSTIHSPVVQLRSGGYLVINQTEALVAVDVNSGRATGERGIEETAVRTNMEATEEVARQLRLRDLSGLVVIDFIDMESNRHNMMVERKLKAELRNDRARIQVGRISPFGLLEMSRQRLRPSIAEASFIPCPHCSGAGLVRSAGSAALHVLRMIEDEVGKHKASAVMVHASEEVILYILNHKRAWLSDAEQRYGVEISFARDPSLPNAQARIERLQASRPIDKNLADETPEAQDNATETPEAENSGANAGAEDGAERPRRRRRRKRRGGSNRSDDESSLPTQEPATAAQQAAPAPAGEEPGVTSDNSATNQASEPKRRRRISRSPFGRPHRPDNAAPYHDVAQPYQSATPADPFAGSIDIFELIEQQERNDMLHQQADASETTTPPAEEQAPAPARKRHRATRAKAADEGAIAVATEATTEADVASPEPESVAPAEEAKPAKRRTATRTTKKATTTRRKKTTEAEDTAPAADAAAPPPDDQAQAAPSEPEAPPKKRATRKAATSSTRARKKAAAAAEEPADKAAPEPEPGPVIKPIVIDESITAPKRTGWWKR